MATTEFIAAIELGSSKISGIAGMKNSDGSIQVHAFAREDSTSFIRKGAIYNVDKTAQALTSVISKLEAQLGNSIAKVYVGIGGLSVRTIKNSISRVNDTEDENNIVTQEFVDNICEENLNTPLAGLKILDVAPQEYRIDNNLQVEPVGAIGKNITGEFLNVVGRESLKKSVDKSFAQAKVIIDDDLILAPVALANAMLTENEMNSGCALVDFGADTTTVQVYKSGILRHLCVLPLGGNNITRDITSKQIEWADAEQLKLKFGDALYTINEEEATPEMATLTNGTAIELEVLNDIIGARAEEILTNVWRQIESSGYSQELFAGTFFTGGASNLKNLDEAYRKIASPKSLKVLKTVRETVHGLDQQSKDGTWCTLLGIMMQGKSNCCMQEARRVIATEPQQTSMTFETERLSEEEARLEQEAKANKEREEELRRKKEKEEEEERKRKERERKEKERKEKEKQKKPSKWATLFDRITEDFLGDGDKE